MTVMGAIFFLLAAPMFRLFCPGEGQQPIIDEGVPVLRLVAFAMPALASCIIFTSACAAPATRVFRCCSPGSASSFSVFRSLTC